MANPIERWMDKRSATPFRTFSQLQDSFDQLFSDFMNLKQTNGLQQFQFTPSCEVTEEGGNYLLKFDLPGVPKDQVKVEVDKNQITVSAERKEEKKQEGKKKYLSEVYYGSYTRSFTLPEAVDEKKVDAKFENGVLTVMVPKTEAQKAKQIPVQ